VTAESVRQSDAYQVRTPESALELAQEIGDNSVFFLNPLLAGIDADMPWEMLHLYERAYEQENHPYLHK
jgi:hypothetical protein